MTQSEIEMAKLKSNEDISKRHEDREDQRNKRSAYTGMAGKAMGLVGKMLNDPSWYKQYQGLDGVNTSIPDFTVGDGEDEMLRKEVGTVDGNTSVFRALYLQTIGQARILGNTVVSSEASYKGKGEINSAISRIRANLGKRNSLAFTLSKDTFGRYMIATVDGLFVPMKRLKVALDWYTVANAFYPKLAEKVITALGFNYGDFSDNIANYRDEYNKWANKINESIPMVKSTTFLERRVFLAGLGLKDRNDARAQHVIFCPENEAYMSTGDDLVRYYSVDNQSYAEFFTIIEDNFAILTDGATWKQVIRLFLGGFQESEFYKLPTNPDVVTATVGYSEEIMNQLHNARLCPTLSSEEFGYDGSNLYLGKWIGSSFTIGGNSQEDVIQGIAAEQPNWGSTTGIGSIIPKYGPAQLRMANPDMPFVQNFASCFARSTVDVGKMSVIFNGFKKPTADDYLVGTRLTGVFGCAYITDGKIESDPNLAGLHGTKPAATVYYAVYPLLYGTEILDCIMSINSSDIVGASSARSVTLRDTWNGDDYVSKRFKMYTSDLFAVSLTAIQEKLAPFTAIDWLPLTKVRTSQNSFTTYGELSHYTEIPAGSLRKLHGQAILSEFSIAEKVFLPPLK